VKLKLNCGLVIALCLAASVGWADSLELKNGSLIKGMFLGGTESEISFQVGLSVQKYNISDIVSLRFDSEKTASDVAKQPESALPDGPRPVATLVSITIPAGTLISVRTIDVIDSTKNQIGDRFQASLAVPLMVDGKVVVAKGTDVYGRLAESKGSGTFTGRSQLRLELTAIVMNGKTLPVVTGEYELIGKSQGASTAKRTIGGAALGSIFGAIAGGGEGAAIGAGAGAAVGAGSEITTKGDQVKVPSETLLDFTLQQDVPIAIRRN
jgi:outer membrane lipoprotein SlyB